MRIKKLILILIISLLALNSSIIHAEDIEAKSITVEKNLTLNLDLNEKKNVNAKILPENATNKGIIYTSEDENIAKVDKNGNVIPIKVGNTKIISTSAENNLIKATTLITIESKYIIVSFDPNGGNGTMNPLKVEKGKNFTVPQAEFSHPQGKILDYWHVDVFNKDIKPNSSYAATTDIVLIAHWKDPILIKSISLNKTELELISNNKYYNTAELKVTFNPINVSDKTIKWTSSDPNIALVTKYGQVVAKNPGNVIITATTVNNKIATCNVTVITEATDIEMVSEITINLDTNEKYQLKPNILPIETTDKSLFYEIFDEDIASVDENGIISPLKAGETYVYARTINDIENKAKLKVTSQYYVVNIDGNGGKGNMPSFKIKKYDRFILPNNEFIGPDGSTFKVWKAENSDLDFIPGNYAWLEEGEELNLYATWNLDLDICELNPTLGWRHYNNRDFWYESERKQGIYNSPGNVWYDNLERGREIYDPCSNGWYWLDAIYDGAKAINKEVFMPYIYSNEDTFDDKTINQLANESNIYTESNIRANMSDQIIKAIKEKTGKWVRYDAQGKMIKGWYTVSSELDKSLYPYQVGNTYFYDYKTGLMAKGETVIDGLTYYFDEITGVLQN